MKVHRLSLIGVEIIQIISKCETCNCCETVLDDIVGLILKDIRYTDIDKAFILGASIDDNGFFIDWSPYFDYTDKQSFITSFKLPLPNGKKVIINEKGINITEAIKSYISLRDNGNNIEALENLITILNTANNEEFIYIDPDIRDTGISIINNHNLYNNDNLYRQLESIKNKVFTEMWSVGSNFSNIISLTSPISVEEGKDAAEAASSFSKYINNNNPAAKAIALFQNSIGKDGIGIAATGIKVYANTLTNAHSKLYKTKNWTLKEWQNTIEELNGKPLGVIDGLVIKGGLVNIIPNVNYDNLASSYLVNDNNELIIDPITGKPISVLDAPILGGNITLRTALETIGAQEDVFLSISVLLSLATDNAKELVLEKINATPDLMGMYIYLFFRGVSFADAASFMTSRIMGLLKEKSKSNIFISGESENSISKAIRYYKKGPDLNLYIPQKYLNSFLNAWYDFKTKNNLDFSSELDESQLNKNTSYGEDLRDILTSKLFIENCDKFKEYINNPNISIRANDQTLFNIDHIDPIEFLEIMIDYAQSLLDLDTLGLYISDKTNIKILFNRFLEDCKRRYYQVEDINPEKLLLSLTDIEEIRAGADELTLLGRYSSLNQGIKTQIHEQTNFLLKLNENTLKTLKFNKDAKKAILKIRNGESLSDSEDAEYKKLEKYFTRSEINHLIEDGWDKLQFDLNDFVEDPELASFYKHWYKMNCKFTNVLDIISESPNFSLMVRAFTINNEVLDKLTVRRLNILEITKKLRSLGIIKGNLTPKTSRVVLKFLTDCIVNDSFKIFNSFTLPDVKIMWELGVKVILDSPQEVEINLSSIDDRLTFKNYMEEYLINLHNTESDNFAKNLVIKNFLNELKVPYVMSALDIDMSTMSKDINEARISDIVVDYNRYYPERPISNDLRFGDALFLYNLIINKNSNSSYAFTNLFKDDLKNEDSMVYKYLKHIGNLSKEDPLGAINYNMKDLILRMMPNDITIDNLKKVRNSDGSVVYTNEGQEIIIDRDPISNINTLPFTTEVVSTFGKLNLIELGLLLSKYISNGLVEFKLNCD